MFYIKGYHDRDELAAFCEKVAKRLNAHLYVYGIGAGIGILPIEPSDTNHTERILKNLMNTSEMAAKNSHSNTNILFYSAEIDKQFARENGISNEITEILEGTGADRLYLQYQPVLDIASNKISGFEALARLMSDQYGPVPPLEFIPIAEKTNVIVPLGEKIIHKALHFLKRLNEHGHDAIIVTINISTIQILENGFADRLLHMIRDMQLNPRNVGIELTESVFATEQTQINAVIGVLQAAGIKVLIDDFGTGYSSLERESELQFDSLKIAKSFIDKLMVLKPEETITGDIISMAHKLGQCVIAEGVEHAKQLDFLRDHGCDRIQGYLVSKPLDEDAALAFLQKHNDR